jgi:hypothetical protein
MIISERQLHSILIGKISKLTACDAIPLFGDEEREKVL